MYLFINPYLHSFVYFYLSVCVFVRARKETGDTRYTNFANILIYSNVSGCVCVESAVVVDKRKHLHLHTCMHKCVCMCVCVVCNLCVVEDVDHLLGVETRIYRVEHGTRA